MCTSLDAAMAITAVDPVVADMMLVAERDGLVLRPADLALVRRIDIRPATQRERAERSQEDQEGQPQPGIGGGREDLSQRAPPFRPPWASVSGAIRFNRTTGSTHP